MFGEGYSLRAIDVGHGKLVDLSAFRKGDNRISSLENHLKQRVDGHNEKKLTPFPILKQE
ncbi:hypothetical protein ACTXT7_014598 [Hymenolepis weldensis]